GLAHRGPCLNTGRTGYLTSRTVCTHAVGGLHGPHGPTTHLPTGRSVRDRLPGGSPARGRRPTGTSTALEGAARAVGGGGRAAGTTERDRLGTAVRALGGGAGRRQSVGRHLRWRAAARAVGRRPRHR